MAITLYTICNPDVHSNIPSNYRYQWKQKHNSELSLTDEEIFDIWKVARFDWMYPTEEYPHEDDYVLECLRVANLDKPEKE